MFGILIFMLIGFILPMFIYFVYFFQRLIKLFTDNNKLCLCLSVVLAILIIFALWPIFSIRGMFVLHFFFISLFLELFYFILKKVLNNNFKILNLFQRTGIVALVISFLFIGYGYYNMNTVYEKVYTIETDKIDDFKIAAISDLHFGISMDLKELESYCQKIESQNIDMFVLVGDLVDEGTTKEEMIKVCEILGNVESTYGTYFVFGNHDPNFYSSDPQYTKEELVDNLQLNDIKILEDEVIEITEQFVLAGRQDRSVERLTVSELVDEEYQDKFVFMLDHQPYEFDDKVSGGIDLSISGHSHAGQVWPAGPLMELFHINDLNYGYKQIGNSQFITTSGIAGWGFPIRTQEQCEYVIIDIK